MQIAAAEMMMNVMRMENRRFHAMYFLILMLIMADAVRA